MNITNELVSIEQLQKENSLLKQQIAELTAKLHWFEEPTGLTSTGFMGV